MITWLISDSLHTNITFSIEKDEIMLQSWIDLTLSAVIHPFKSFLVVGIKIKLKTLKIIIPQVKAYCLQG